MCKVIQLVKCSAGNKLIRESDSFNCEICNENFSKDLLWFDEQTNAEYCDLCYGIACDFLAGLEEFK